MQWSWDFRFIRNFNHRELQHSSDLLGISEGVRIHSIKEDKRAWTIEI